MNILCIDMPFPLGPAFRALGHRTVELSPAGADADAEQLIQEAGFTPDLVIQQERLAERLLVRSLDQIPCPTLFLAVDAHLNLFWQHCYARLFDAVLSPHLTLFEALPPDRKPPALLRCALPGYARPRRPFAERSVNLAFCARLTPERSVRLRMTELLRRLYGLETRQNLSLGEMLNFYSDARMVPNESIAREVNFRLLEAASCGALIFAQDIGPDQDALFTAGKELRVCRDGRELVEEIGFFLRRPDQAEKTAQAAWERVQREHLPVHRAAEILHFAAGLTRKRAEGDEARRLLWLSAVQLARAGRRARPLSAMLRQGLELAPHPEIAAALLCLQVESGRTDAAGALCRELAESAVYAESLDCNCAAGIYSLLRGDFAGARSFLARHLVRLPENIPERRVRPPESPSEYCRAWAALLRRTGRVARVGFRYRPEAGILPECAVECLLLADHLQRDDPETLRQLDGLCADIPAYMDFRRQILERRCRQAPENWRLLLDAGRTSLAVFRVEEGLAELDAAADAAARAGEARRFARVCRPKTIA
ncbi:MAG: glycosyltransferase [Desulfovibrio sp.]|jgi:hypothetical protein|nr:glycosyltransferase [Desulfovibrio sp.]